LVRFPIRRIVFYLECEFQVGTSKVKRTVTLIVCSQSTHYDSDDLPLSILPRFIAQGQASESTYESEHKSDFSSPIFASRLKS
jgi:hypothetical protein